jgi:molecular chaperone DnaK (HSP70)
MLAARVEPKNGYQESKKTDNFKPLSLSEFQPAVDSVERKLLERVTSWPDEDIEKLDQAVRQIEEWRSSARMQ